MQSSEIRQRFLDFFVERDHRLYPSSSLIPHNDPTVLLTTAGMQQFITYFTGQERPPTPRASAPRSASAPRTSRRSATRRHLTFFEMLGNFSFGDYFKKEAIEWAWEFLTEELGHPARAALDHDLRGRRGRPRGPRSEGALDARRRPRAQASSASPRARTGGVRPVIRAPAVRARRSTTTTARSTRRATPPADPKYGPGGDEGDPRFLEIWNLVFNQYEQLKDGTLTPLAKPGIDTGLGLERTTAALQNVLYRLRDRRLRPHLREDQPSTPASRLAPPKRPTGPSTSSPTTPGRWLSSSQTASDPATSTASTFFSRIIRRATREAYGRLGLSAEQIAALAEVVVDYMGDFYEELREAREDIRRIVAGEAARFIEIYHSGMELLEAEIGRLAGGNLPGEVAFLLHDTYGFPVEVTREVLAERGISLDEAGFEAAMRAQRERAREAMQGYDRVVAAFRDQEIRSRFVGYEREQVETRIVALEPVPERRGRGALRRAGGEPVLRDGRRADC